MCWTERRRERGKAWNCEELETRRRTEDRGDLWERAGGQPEAGGEKSGMISYYLAWPPRPEDAGFSYA